MARARLGQATKHDWNAPTMVCRVCLDEKSTRQYFRQETGSICSTCKARQENARKAARRAAKAVSA